MFKMAGALGKGPREHSSNRDSDDVLTNPPTQLG